MFGLIKIVFKKSSPSLWKDQTAEVEIGLKYEKIDLILKYFETNTVENIHRDLLGKEIHKNELLMIKNLVSKNKHKTTLPKICKI